MIVVPTRYRAGKSATLDALQGRSDLIIATPEDEADAYADAYPMTLIMHVPHGIGKARQAILTEARDHEWGPFWMLDDDINGAYAAHPDLPDGTRRLFPIGIEAALLGIEALIGERGLTKAAVVGPNWRHRAWSAAQIEEDRHVAQFVRIDPASPANYWDHFCEDINFTIESILAGWHSYRVNVFACASPQQGTLEGGCRPDYAKGAMEEGISQLATKYSFISPALDRKTGLLRANVDWKYLDAVTA